MKLMVKIIQWKNKQIILLKNKSKIKNKNEY